MHLLRTKYSAIFQQAAVCLLSKNWWVSKIRRIKATWAGKWLLVTFLIDKIGGNSIYFMRTSAEQQILLQVNTCTVLCLNFIFPPTILSIAAVLLLNNSSWSALCQLILNESVSSEREDNFHTDKESKLFMFGINWHTLTWQICYNDNCMHHTRCMFTFVFNDLVMPDNNWLCTKNLLIMGSSRCW